MLRYKISYMYRVCIYIYILYIYIYIYKGCSHDSVPRVSAKKIRRRYANDSLHKHRVISKYPPLVILMFLAGLCNCRRYPLFLQNHFWNSCRFFFWIFTIFDIRVLSLTCAVCGLSGSQVKQMVGDVLFYSTRSRCDDLYLTCTSTN